MNCAKKHLIYMAAGNSRRFGKNKLFERLQGRPMYSYGLETLYQVLKQNPDCTLTVVSQYPEILQDAEQLSVQIGRVFCIDSPESVQGISYTIKNGIRSILMREGEEELIRRGDVLVFVTADQPKLTVQTVEKLIRTEPCETASVCYGDQPGNPTLFSAALIPELMELEGDQGGRRVIRKHACVMVPVECERELWDLDVPEDLDRFSL